MKGHGSDGYKEHWESTYGSCSDYFGNDLSEFGRRSIQLFRERNVHKVLELGCGQGRDTCHLVKEGFDVHAIDYSSTGLEQLRGRMRTDDLCCELKVHDMRDSLPYEDGSFDAVYSHMLFTMDFTMDELSFMMAECLRVLRKGGINAYSVRNHDDPHYGRFEPVREDTWRNPKGFIVHFLSREKVMALSQGYKVIGVDEFREGNPQNEKVLYAVFMEKPIDGHG